MTKYWPRGRAYGEEGRASASTLSVDPQPRPSCLSFEVQELSLESPLGQINSYAYVSTFGIARSSTKTRNFLPCSGPKMRPVRFEMLSSTVFWKSREDVRDE